MTTKCTILRGTLHNVIETISGGRVDGRSLFLRRFLDRESSSATSAFSADVACIGAPGSPLDVDRVIVEEAALIERAQAGDQDAFAVLVQRYQRQVYNLALRMLRDTDEASEATQEAFLAAWRHLGRFRQDARFATWLYRITYHHCLKVSECL